ncbi:MAG: hypothetical protein J6U14_00175, partial [Bacteroidaceae bacterium]|nr:hypothetical protein [Bacteroidaceae bacterium]
QAMNNVQAMSNTQAMNNVQAMSNTQAMNNVQAMSNTQAMNSIAKMGSITKVMDAYDKAMGNVNKTVLNQNQNFSLGQRINEVINQTAAAGNSAKLELKGGLN